MSKVEKIVLARYIVLSVIVLASLWLFTEKAFAYELPDECYYTYPERRDEVYALLCADGVIDDNGYYRDVDGRVLYVLKDSMCTCYSVDTYGFDVKGEPKLIVYGVDEAGDMVYGNYNCVKYGFKLIDSANEHAGGLSVYYKDHKILKVRASNPEWSDGMMKTASATYADNAERISYLLGLDYIIPATDVRRVTFMSNHSLDIFNVVGTWVKHKDIEAFIPDAAITKSNEVVPNKYVSYYSILKKDELYEYCRNINANYTSYMAYIEELKREWEKMHPNEPYTAAPPALGGGPSLETPIIPEYQINNIINITEYLHLDKVKWRKRINPIYILLGIYGATAAMIVAVMLMDRRKTN